MEFQTHIISNKKEDQLMKGMIYRDGKFISVLADVDISTLYDELLRHKKKHENKPKKKKTKKK